MDDCKVLVGLDDHQDSVHVASRTRAARRRGGRVALHRRYKNDWESIVNAASGHGTVSPVAIESCSGAANLADVE